MQQKIESPIAGYTITETLGKGTYGTVYKAIKNDNMQVVAIKKIKFPNEQEGIPATAIVKKTIISLSLLNKAYFIEKNLILFNVGKLLFFSKKKKQKSLLFHFPQILIFSKKLKIKIKREK